MLWLRIQQLKSSNADTRAQAVKSLAESKSQRVFDALVEAARDKSEKVRAAAVLGITQFEGVRTVTILTTALQDPHPDVRKAAVEALKSRPEALAKSALSN